MGVPVGRENTVLAGGPILLLRHRPWPAVALGQGRPQARTAGPHHCLSFEGNGRKGALFSAPPHSTSTPQSSRRALRTHDKESTRLPAACLLGAPGSPALPRRPVPGAMEPEGEETALCWGQ